MRSGGVYYLSGSPGSPLEHTSLTVSALATLITFFFKFRSIKLGVQGQRQGNITRKSIMVNKPLIVN